MLLRCNRRPHCYRELLILRWICRLAHPNPKNVFIGGGGEFATAREVMRHNSVEKCVMVDIDKVACDVCREQLPEWNGGAYEDPRFEVYYEDAKAWLENSEIKFDVIIMDICDPIEAGPGICLYELEFYQWAAANKLNPGGTLVTQSGVGSVLVGETQQSDFSSIHSCSLQNPPQNTTECFTVIYQTLQKAFDNVVPYTADIPSFGFNWGFNLAFNNEAAVAIKAKEAGQDPAAAFQETTVKEIDDAIVSRIKGGADLRFMDGVSYRGVMGVPKPVRKALAEEKRVISKDNHVYSY